MARQYGEVVLPDASTGLGPGTPPHAEPENCQGVGFRLLAGARFSRRSAAKSGVWVQEPVQICLESRKSKKCDKQLTHSCPCYV